MGGFERTRDYVKETQAVGAILAVTNHPENRHIVDTLISPRAMGFTGNTCSNCGGAHMFHAGHCECCSDCGTTTGCS